MCVAIRILLLVTSGHFARRGGYAQQERGNCYMAEDERHIALARLWEYSRDPDSPAILFEEQNHLTTCQDCIGILWLCRGSASVDEVRKIL
jgi:hypothetical protein